MSSHPSHLIYPPHLISHKIYAYAYMKRWQQYAKFGKWVTADESRLSGWYHSEITIGPDPKLIRTGATLQSFFAVTHGKLKFYKLYARMYGAKYDNDVQGWHEHTVGEQKFVCQSIWSHTIIVSRKGTSCNMYVTWLIWVALWLWLLVISRRSIWSAQSNPIIQLHRCADGIVCERTTSH